MKIVIMIVALLLIRPGLSVSAASAKTLNKKTLKAYQSVLKKGYYTFSENNHTWRMNINEFTIIDINKDGISEMITQSSRYGQKDVWVLKGSKAKRIFSFTPYQGTAVSYDKKNKSVRYAISMTVGINADGFFRMRSKTAVDRFEYGFRWNGKKMKPYWYVNGKKVSEKTFKKKSKLKSSTSIKMVTFHSNNVTNRKRIEKMKAF